MHIKQDVFLQKNKKEQQSQNPVLQKKNLDFQIKIEP
jgi:hypothetical protein